MRKELPNVPLASTEIQSRHEWAPRIALRYRHVSRTHCSGVRDLLPGAPSDMLCPKVAAQIAHQMPKAILFEKGAASTRPEEIKAFGEVQRSHEAVSSICIQNSRSAALICASDCLPYTTDSSKTSEIQSGMWEV
eukprot:s1171_g12.t1